MGYNVYSLCVRRDDLLNYSYISLDTIPLEKASRFKKEDQ